MSDENLDIDPENREPLTSKEYIGVITLTPILPMAELEIGFVPVLKEEPVPKIIPPILIESLLLGAKVIPVPIIILLGPKLKLAVAADPAS